MRWFVEVSTIGDSAAPGRVCVEAAQWQAALESARRLLKDDSPLSKFSIEVLDDGYRAANPALRTRYVVRRAPPNAVLTDEAHISQSTIPPPRDSRELSTRPAPASRPQSLTVPTDAVPPAPEPQPPPRSLAETRSAAPEQTAPVIQPPPLPSPIAPEPSWVLRRRMEQASAESPLLYCEVAFTVVPGLPREAVERVLLHRFREICTEIERQPVRKYVQLAIFDHAFEKKPLRAPLATLAWKDWRGVPSIGFPAFGEAAATAPASSLPPRVPGWGGLPSEPPSAPLQSRPKSSIPPSSDAVGVIPSVPVGPGEVPKPPALPKIKEPS